MDIKKAWIQETQVPRIINRLFYNFDSVLSKRIFYAAMALIKKGFGVQKDIHNELWLDVPTSILGDQNFTRLSKATDHLQGARIPFINEKDEEFLKITPFPVIHYTKRSGIVRLKVDSDAFPCLAELGDGYFWLKLKSMMLLSSKHAQKWYELFSERKDLGKFERVELDYIRKVMMVGEFEYKRNEAFLRRVIYEPIKEINEKTELFIQYTPMFGQKRPIVGFDFTIRGQKAKGEAEMYERIEKHYAQFRELSSKEKADEIAELQKIYGFSPKAFNEMLENHSILNAVLEAHEKVKNGKVLIQTTKEQFMGGVIRKAKENLQSSN